MPLIAVIALAAGALIVLMLAIAFVEPKREASPKASRSRSPMARPQATIQRGPMPSHRLAARPDTPKTAARAPWSPRRLTWRGFTQAAQSAVGDARTQVRRFLVLLESDRRNLRQFRNEHPDTNMFLVAGVAAVVLGLLVARL